jgi:hypothetical protein
MLTNDNTGLGLSHPLEGDIGLGYFQDARMFTDRTLDNSANFHSNDETFNQFSTYHLSGIFPNCNGSQWHNFNGGP